MTADPISRISQLEGENARLQEALDEEFKETKKYYNQAVEQYAEITTLREALRPFAEAGQRMIEGEERLIKDFGADKVATDDSLAYIAGTTGDYRRAARALEGK